MQHVEIERKYLLPERPDDLDTYPADEIEQGYLAIDGEVEVRLRRRNGGGTVLTLKGGSGEQRLETEFDVDETLFAALWPLTRGRRLRKLRRVLPADDGLVIEVDEYLGRLKGLAIAEVEFPSREASTAFQPPPWFGDEVTGDPHYSNQALARYEQRIRAERAFALRRDETIADGIRRIVLGQIDEVLDRLDRRADEDLARAVHESRKSLKRLRATARLVRPELSEPTFRRENECFRDVARLLSGPRDSEVLIQALDGLGEHYQVESAGIDSGRFRDELVRRRDAARADLDERSGLLVELRATLEAARNRVPEWRIGDNGFGAVAKGLRRTYRKGRRAYRASLREPMPEHLHEWRKRVKDLWHSLQILEAAAPAQMKAMAKTAHDLSDVLGDDHDLAVLEQEMAAHRGTFSDEDSRTVLTGLCERRRSELQVQAFGIGAALYGESPSAFVRRIRDAWQKGEQPA